MDSLCKKLKTRVPSCRILTVALDLRSPEACEELVARHVTHHQHIDSLILNHGVQTLVDEIEDLSNEQWLNTFAVNIHPYFYIAKAALKHMPRGGSINMNSSVNHFKGNPKLLDYTATKGAMVGFARALSNAIVDTRGIRVNGEGLGPGQVLPVSLTNPLFQS